MVFWAKHCRLDIRNTFPIPYYKLGYLNKGFKKSEVPIPFILIDPDCVHQNADSYTHSRQLLEGLPWTAVHTYAHLCHFPSRVCRGFRSIV